MTRTRKELVVNDREVPATTASLQLPPDMCVFEKRTNRSVDQNEKSLDFPMKYLKHNGVQNELHFRVAQLS